jgi:hypothetical protein
MWGLQRSTHTGIEIPPALFQEAWKQGNFQGSDEK